MQDIGCCFGQDTRQMILNGIPQSSIKATDITPQYWSATFFCRTLPNDGQRIPALFGVRFMLGRLH